MKTYAVIDRATHVIENTVLWDGESLWTPPATTYLYLLEGQEIGIGFTHDPETNTFSAPVYPEAQALEQPTSTGTQTL